MGLNPDARKSKPFSVHGVNPGSLRLAITVNIVGSFDVVRGSRMLQLGAGVTLLGYICALLGMLLLPSPPQPSRR